MTSKLTRRQYESLRWAVMRAGEWRGAIVGNPDTAPLEAFDREILIAKAALLAIRPTVKPKEVTK